MLGTHCERYYTNIVNDIIYSYFATGFCTTVVASPVDVVKTRFMNSPPGMYRGAANCALKMFGQEGFSAFYKG